MHLIHPEPLHSKPKRVNMLVLLGEQFRIIKASRNYPCILYRTIAKSTSHREKNSQIIRIWKKKMLQENLSE
ncbi:hypothetical protein EXN66_Car004523 [Channa argus]|uniref:Uncharacterized protein n=1 Tax=Channa argus TaxID=215402 RepID=A0A6G1PEW0_CHAAH|nr:hypothetical protein EXN66_Car004523 [Channa argus]